MNSHLFDALQKAPWPGDRHYRLRYFVPDLTPAHRPELAGLAPRVAFVAESPHESEVNPEALDQRRPLCGKAGREWWKMVSQIVAPSEPRLSSPAAAVDTSLERLLELCRRGQIVVLNAVEFPLDPKIQTYYGPSSDPLKYLHFTKVAPDSFKKHRTRADVQTAVSDLRRRLTHPSLAKVPVISLGNDAQWFVAQALAEGPESAASQKRHLMTVPHPSAWWRQGGKLRQKAWTQLKEVLC